MSWLRLMEERMKEMEKTAAPGAADDTAGAAAAPSPRKKKNRILHLLSEMWPAYLIEVVVIIVGITITLALEEWRDKGKERELEKVYKENLATDIDADMQSLRYALGGTDSLLAQGAEIQQFVNDPDGHPLSVVQLNRDVRGLISRPKFISNDATFSDLKSSGNLHLITDVALKGLLFAYYSKAENIRQNQDAEQQATIMLSGKFFLQNFALDGADDPPVLHDAGGLKGLAKNIEFRNHLLSRVGTRMELRQLYKDADKMAYTLKAILRDLKD